MTPPDAPAGPPGRRGPDGHPARERSLASLLIYRLAQALTSVLFRLIGGFRATGAEHIPDRGAALLVSNHLSFWDVFVLGVGSRRPLNFVARSSLFRPVLGPIIRVVGGFPIQRDGMGAQGFKETLRRLKAGGIVTLFPEGTRSPDGELKELKPGIATLATRARVPIIPAGIAGTFEAWPRHRRFPRPHPLRIHFGPPISPEALAELSPEAATALIRDRIREAIAVARDGLGRPLSGPPPSAGEGLVRS